MEYMKHKILKMEKLLFNLVKMNEFIHQNEIEKLDVYFQENQGLLAEIVAINEQLLVSNQRLSNEVDEKINQIKQAILVQNQRNVEDLKEIKTVVKKDLKVMNQKVAASVAYNNMKRLNY